MPDAGRQMWKNRISKGVEFNSIENRKMSKKQKNEKKRTKRNGESKKKWWKRRRDERRDNEKNDPSCNDKNDPWSNHPETQFGPIYPFFRNHEPWPTLRT